MPHLVLTISPQLAAHKIALLEAGHAAMLASGLFGSGDIKSRVLAIETCLVGEHSADAFVHASVSLLRKPERTTAIQKNLSHAVMLALQTALPKQNIPVQFSCEINEINPEVYGKKRVV